MEENKEIKSNSKNKLPIIIMGIALFLIGVGVGLLVVGTSSSSNNSESGNKENIEENNNNELIPQENNETEVIPQDNNENVVEDNTEVTPQGDKENEVKPLVINDDINKLYKKYHSMANPIILSNNRIEKYFYESDEFNISQLSSIFPSWHAYFVLAQTANKIVSENNIESLEELKEKVYDQLEQEFNNYFGKNVKYSKEFFGCWELTFEDGMAGYTNNCEGDLGFTVKAKYELTKAEQDSNNIYLYEKVEFTDTTTTDVTFHNYKWTLEKQDNGIYYLLKVEKIS